MLVMHVTNEELQIVRYESISAAEDSNEIHGLFYNITSNSWVSEEFLREAYGTVLKKPTLNTLKELMFWNEIHSDKRVCDVCSKKISCMLDGRFNANDAVVYIKCKVPSLKSKEAQIDKPLISMPLVHPDNGITGVMLKDYTSALIKLAEGKIENILPYKNVQGTKDITTNGKELAQNLKLLLHMHWPSLYKKQYHPRKDVLYLRTISTVMPIVGFGYNPKKVSILPRRVYSISNYKIFV